MLKIEIISSSIRLNRKSHRVALYLKKLIEEKGLSTVDIIDLRSFNFQVFDERFKNQTNPSAGAKEFSQRVSSADGIIIIAPEYNGGYPASLKNAIDLLYDEWYHKPVAISTVSDGDFGGNQVITSLQFILWKMKAMTVTATLPVPNVDKAIDEAGNPVEGKLSQKRTENFLNELMWFIRAKNSPTDM
jgi:NAD(P)H-dependent FMN reductase